jgi:hypothetical protein
MWPCWPGRCLPVIRKRPFYHGEIVEVNEVSPMDEYAVRQLAELGYFDLVIHKQ